MPYVYQKLLPDTAYAKRFNHKQYTVSGIIFYWGIDKVYPELRHHNVFLSKDYRESFTRTSMDNTMSENPTVYINAPARTDSTAAPPNQDTLYAMVEVSHLEDGKKQDWEKMKLIARSTILRRLSKIGINDFEKHIKFEISYGPYDWLSRFNLTRGSTFSLRSNPSQTAYFRPKKRHHKYKNLYFVGANTHPGNGVPMSILSAQMTAERIIKEN